MVDRALSRRILRRFGLVRTAPPRDPFEGLRAIDGPTLVRVPSFRIDPAGAAKPRLNVLLPAVQLARSSGGPNTALNLAGRVIAHGIPLRLVSTSLPVDPDRGPILRHLETLIGHPVDPASVEFVDASPGSGPARFGSRDAFLATLWTTAYLADAAARATTDRGFIYLVQDYEPGFMAWSTGHALAAATYGFPHRSIYNEPILRDYFAAHGIGRVDDADDGSIAFMPAVDRTLFHPEPPAGPRRFLFYARPRTDRNLFELGLRALRLAAARGAFDPARWSVVSIGETLPTLDVAPGIAMANAPWMDYPAYAGFVRGSSAMLSLMLSPHTSYPPLEMAASGGVVVTNTFDVKTAEVLAAISPHIVGVAPTADALAAAIFDAATTDPPTTNLLATERGGALPASWDEAFADVVPWMVAAVRDMTAG